MCLEGQGGLLLGLHLHQGHQELQELQPGQQHLGQTSSMQLCGESGAVGQEPEETGTVSEDCGSEQAMETLLRSAPVQSNHSVK